MTLSMCQTEQVAHRFRLIRHRQKTRLRTKQNPKTGFPRGSHATESHGHSYLGSRTSETHSVLQRGVTVRKRDVRPRRRPRFSTPFPSLTSRWCLPPSIRPTRFKRSEAKKKTSDAETQRSAYVPPRTKKGPTRHTLRGQVNRVRHAGSRDVS